MSEASDIAHRLKASRAGDGWGARCPAHDDRHASLSISEGEGGKLLLYCHAGCTFDRIRAALDLRGTRLNGHDAGKARIVATYDYHDAASKLVYQVVRYEPKDFRQRRPDDTGGWIWKTADVEKVPYRLPQLLDASEVYVCEGEKDCDNLARLGVTATTNPGGADKDGEGGKKWPNGFGRWFHGRQAILIPDNDESGKRHVRAVARKLYGHAASIRILELPGLPPKGDVSDWLAAGGTREQLESMAAAASFWEPQPDETGEDASAWAEPIDIIGAPELVGWPDLTPDCLPAPLYDYATNEAERLNVDPCALSAHVLVAVSTVCSDAWRIKPKRYDNWTQQPRIWSCVVKDVGQRGTDMLRAAFWPVVKIENDLRQQWQREMAAWLEQNQTKKKDEQDPRPALPRLTTQDATIEAASQILAAGNEYSKLTYKADELVTFLGGAGRYTPKGDAARGLWLEGYDGGPQHIDRVIRGNVYVPNWSIAVAGNIQPRRLRDMAKGLIDDGLFQRFITIHTKPAAPCADDDQPLNVSAGSDYEKLTRAIRSLMPAANAEGEYAPVYFDDDARAVRQDFMPLIDRLKFDANLPMIIRETAPKWSGLLARLALIFHIVELAQRQINGENLTDQAVCRATVRTVTTAATYLRRIVLPNLFRLGYETMPEEGAPAAHARWIAGYILAHKSEQIRAREIGRAYNALRGKPQEISEIMQVLCDSGWAAPVDARCDSACWQINPAVHGRFKEAAEAEARRRDSIRDLIRKKVSDL